MFLNSAFLKYCKYNKKEELPESQEELELHTLVNPSRPDCFSYEFRIAYDYKRRLKEWRITLPKLKLDSSDYIKSKELNERLISLCKKFCNKSKKLKIEIENLLKK